MVDGGVCFLKSKDVEGNHQAGADNGCARAIHAESGQSADGQYKIGTKKDESGSQHVLYFLLHFGQSSVFPARSDDLRLTVEDRRLTIWIPKSESSIVRFVRIRIWITRPRIRNMVNERRPL